MASNLACYFKQTNKPRLIDLGARLFFLEQGLLFTFKPNLLK